MTIALMTFGKLRAMGWLRILVFGAAFICGCASSPVAQSEKSQPVEFVGTTPCDALPRKFLNISKDAESELIQWHLSLHFGDAAKSSGTYALLAIHGRSETNAPGLFQGGTKLESKGRWTMSIGRRADKDATVYRLEPMVGHGLLSLVKIDENLLHLLTDEGALMVGNDSWSYTLNRVQ